MCNSVVFSEFLLLLEYKALLCPVEFMFCCVVVLDGALGGPSGIVKPDRTRRSWSKREEEVLVMALHDIVAGGWKADNDFRSGHSKMVYNVLKREIPNTELRVSPHINSKISTWK